MVGVVVGVLGTAEPVAEVTAGADVIGPAEDPGAGVPMDATVVPATVAVEVDVATAPDPAEVQPASRAGSSTPASRSRGRRSCRERGEERTVIGIAALLERGERTTDRAEQTKGHCTLLPGYGLPRSPPEGSADHPSTRGERIQRRVERGPGDPVKSRFGSARRRKLLMSTDGTLQMIFTSCIRRCAHLDSVIMSTRPDGLRTVREDEIKNQWSFDCSKYAGDLLLCVPALS